MLEPSTGTRLRHSECNANLVDDFLMPLKLYHTSHGVCGERPPRHLLLANLTERRHPSFNPIIIRHVQIESIRQKNKKHTHDGQINASLSSFKHNGVDNCQDKHPNSMEHVAVGSCAVVAWIPQGYLSAHECQQSCRKRN